MCYGSRHAPAANALEIVDVVSIRRLQLHVVQNKARNFFRIEDVLCFPEDLFRERTHSGKLVFHSAVERCWITRATEDSERRRLADDLLTMDLVANLAWIRRNPSQWAVAWLNMVAVGMSKLIGRAVVAIRSSTVVALSAFSHVFHRDTGRAATNSYIVGSEKAYDCCECCSSEIAGMSSVDG